MNGTLITVVVVGIKGDESHMFRGLPESVAMQRNHRLEEVGCAVQELAGCSLQLTT